MTQFRRKPVVVDAVQFVDSNFDEIERFCGSAAEVRAEHLVIRTLEGPLHASPGDWIVRGVIGECYPVKPDVFAKIYEAVDV